LPKAFEREVGLGKDAARELLRSVLAEGKIVAILRTPLGHRYDIPQRMWDKDRVAKKVYPRFHDGWMRMGLNEFSGPYVEGWIFVPKGSVERTLQRDQQKPVRKPQFSIAKIRRWYLGYVSRHQKSGTRPSREDDLLAARAALGRNLPRKIIRDLRRELAPDEWKRAGPRKSGRK
jgi:hypothetical protein